MSIVEHIPMDKVWAYLRDFAARINILGTITLFQGFITLGISWMVFLRAETAPMVSNDTKAQFLHKLSVDQLVRLRAVKSRINEVGKNNEKFEISAAAMLVDLESAIQDADAIRQYCADMQNRLLIDRWRKAKDISVELMELEARAKDPSHLLNLVLSGVFALIMQAGGQGEL